MAPHIHGLLVTLDGPSGVGKTTVAALLHDRLKADTDVMLTTTPSTSPIGHLARTSTYDFHGIELTLLVAADRYHHERSVLRPALMRGAVVVCDRYVASSLVLDVLDGVDRALVWNIYRHMPAPGIAVVMQGDPHLCAQRAAMRGHYSRFHTKDPSQVRQEHAGFDAAARFLQRNGYPIVRYPIKEAPAEHVADQLAALVRRRRDHMP